MCLLGHDFRTAVGLFTAITAWNSFFVPLAFYGPDHEHGYAREYLRAHGSAAAADDPFALQLADNTTPRAGSS